jgi:hypothetical protein
MIPIFTAVRNRYFKKEDRINMVQIAVINVAKNLALKDLEAYVAAYNIQANQHFAPARGLLGVNIYIPNGKPAVTDWVITFADNVGVAGALGYHDVTASGMPIAIIGVDTTLQAQSSVSVCGSHELLEMMGDPLIILSMQVSGTMMYAFEACDAPEDDKFGYEISVPNYGPVLVSDWVYSSWFATERPGPYDYKGHIQKPLEILPGGYIGALDISKTNGWTQIVVQAKHPAAHHAGGHGTRFDKRIRSGGFRRSTAV